MNLHKNSHRFFKESDSLYTDPLDHSLIGLKLKLPLPLTATGNFNRLSVILEPF